MGILFLNAQIIYSSLIPAIFSQNNVTFRCTLIHFQIGIVGDVLSYSWTPLGTITKNYIWKRPEHVIFTQINANWSHRHNSLQLTSSVANCITPIAITPGYNCLGFIKCYRGFLSASVMPFRFIWSPGCFLSPRRARGAIYRLRGEVQRLFSLIKATKGWMYSQGWIRHKFPCAALDVSGGSGLTTRRVVRTRTRVPPTPRFGLRFFGRNAGWRVRNFDCVVTWQNFPLACYYSSDVKEERVHLPFHPLFDGIHYHLLQKCVGYHLSDMIC